MTRVTDSTDPAKPVLLQAAGSPSSRSAVEVQPLDRFVDEDGSVLKENSHPGARPFTRAEMARILRTEIGR